MRWETRGQRQRWVRKSLPGSSPSSPKSVHRQERPRFLARHSRRLLARRPLRPSRAGCLTPARAQSSPLSSAGPGGREKKNTREREPTSRSLVSESKKRKICLPLENENVGTKIKNYQKLFLSTRTALPSLSCLSRHTLPSPCSVPNHFPFFTGRGTENPIAKTAQGQTTKRVLFLSFLSFPFVFTPTKGASLPRPPPRAPPAPRASPRRARSRPASRTASRH